MESSASALVTVLTQEYGVQPTDLTPGPRGFVGETYVVDTAGGRRLFAKILPPAPHLPRLVHSLPVLEELHALGLPVNHPVRSRGGALAVPLAARMLIVFDYIAHRPRTRWDYDFAAAEDSPPAQQARYIADLRETCFDWLWPLMRACENPEGFAV